MTKTRELKFRAWDNRTSLGKGMFWYEDDVCVHDDVWNIGHMKGNDIQQYTGLKDKNGKEIYEGDIFLHAADAQDEDGDPRPFHGVVIWLEDLGAWGWYPPEATVAMSTLMPESGDIEIVGNIYENPELLAGDKHGKE